MTYQVNPNLLGLAFLVLLNFACQQEIENIDPIDDTKNLSADSPSIDLLSRVTMMDGSVDNVLDAASCLRVELPVTLTIEDTSFQVISTDDYAIVSKALNDRRLSSEAIRFDYPVTITTWDHNRLIIQDEDDLEEWVDECEEGEDEDIECIDIVYPIVTNGFNLQTEQLESFTFESDHSFHFYLSQVDDEDVFSIDYPMFLVAHDGTEYNISDNTDLEQTIEANAQTCDEADDLFMPTPDPQFLQWLTGIDWEVGLYFDEEDLTSNYTGANFDFRSDSTLHVTIDSSPGEWEVRVEEGHLILEIEELEGDFLEDINESWVVIEYGATQIVMTDESNEQRLIFRESSDEEEVSPLAQNMMANEVWVVSSYLSEGEDETEEYAALQFYFEEEGRLNIIESQTITYTASWSAIGIESLVLSVDGGEWEDLHNTWEVVSFSAAEVILSYQDEDSEINKQLIFSAL